MQRLFFPKRLRVTHQASGRLRSVLKTTFATPIALHGCEFSFGNT